MLEVGFVLCCFECQVGYLYLKFLICNIDGIAYSSARYGAGSGPIYLTEVLCTSTETSLLRCKSDPILSGNCSHAEDAGVKCEGM